jgi:predicted acetyltransferase
MLDPLTALGLTANIIQLINFVRNTLNDANEIYKSGTGTSVRYLELEAVSYRLSQLMTSLRNQIPSKQENGAWNKSEFYDHQISDADKQLLTLVTQAVEISDQLESLLRRLRTRTEGRWHSVRQAVKSAWKDSEIIALEDRLHKVREEIQTNILVSMRCEKRHCCFVDEILKLILDKPSKHCIKRATISGKNLTSRQQEQTSR